LKPRKRGQAKKRNPSRLRTYTFLITTVVILVIVIASWYQTLPRVDHIPDAFEFKPYDWMTFVPNDAQYVAYVNYGQAYAITHNASLYGTKYLFELPQLGFQILPMDILYEVEIELPPSQYSGSATVLKFTPQKQTELINDLESVKPATVNPPVNYDGYKVYELLMRKFGDQIANQGFLSIVNQQLIFSNDKSSARQNVQAILDEISFNAAGLFDDVTVRQAVFATGVTDQEYVGLYVAKFATQLNDTKMIVKSVIGNGDSISVARALLFPSSDVAVARLAQAHQVYRNAASYRILDSWLVVTYNYPLYRLQSELIGV
jgi:hypothetical protein